MKRFEKIDDEQLRKAWNQRFDESVSYYGGKDVAFSPAVQAQVSPFGNPSTGEMPMYYMLHGTMTAYQYTNWLDEANAIANSCYIGDWSWLNKWRLSGPDAIACLEASTINGYANFPVGKGRHIISVTPDGKMIGDGIAFHESEDTYLLTGGLMIAPGAMIKADGFDVKLEDLTPEMFNFHIQGPSSGKVIGKLCGEDVSDLGFIRFRDITMCGQTIRLYRGGMSGELGYEIFGDSAYGSVIWQAVVEAGAEFGIRQLGQRELMLNHLQAFFPTIWVDFVPSVVPGAEAMYRSPVDYGWGNLVDKTRDFPGKDALLSEMEHPMRTSVTLEWNNDDCIDVFRSLFDKDQMPLHQFEMPVNTSTMASGDPAALPILDAANNFVGFATNRGYSLEFRKFLSLAVVNVEAARLGNELYVVYGNEGERQTRIRTTVAPVPYKADKRK